MPDRFLVIAAAFAAVACSSSAQIDPPPSGAGGQAASSSAGGSTGASGGATGSGASATQGPGGSSQGGSSQGGQGGSSQGGGGQGGGAQGGSAQGGSAQGGSAQGGGGQGGQSGSPCTWSPTSNPCPNGFYCNAPGCNTGTCEPISTTNDPIKAAVCGCDNVNYWNATTAANFGMAVAANGECPQPEFCGGIATLPCPHAGHSCSQVFPNMGFCNISDPGGACWGMPSMCNPIVIGGTHRPCFGQVCTTECEAIKSEVGYYPDNTCPQ